MQLFGFVLFYSFAIIYKKDSFKHMRFMVGTALIMIGPGLSRTLNEYGGAGITAYTATIALSLKTVLAAALLGKDLLSKKSWIPYTVVLMALLLSDLVYYARYSVVWQGFGKFVINNLY